MIQQVHHLTEKVAHSVNAVWAFSHFLYSLIEVHMIKTVLKTTVMTALACWSLCGHAESNAILGGVQLDVTTLGPYVQKMKQNCSGIQVDGPVAIVPATCYKLPGQVVILMADPKDPTQKIVGASILYQKDFNHTLFKKYLDSLTNKYGEPVSSQIRRVGNKTVRWIHGDIIITLDEPHLELNGQVTYLTKRMDDLVKQQQVDQERQEKQNIESML